MSLVQNLRERTAAAKDRVSAKQAAVASATDGRWENQPGQPLAEGILCTLEAKMGALADEGKSELRVMPLDTRRHWDTSRLSDEMALQEELRLMGASPGLFKGAAKMLVSHLLTLDGIKVGIEIEPQVDESQSRSWNNVYLMVSWAD